MDIPQQALDLIEQFEGCVLKAYPDPASGREPYTVGYGSTNGSLPPGESFTLGDVITKDKAIEWMTYNITTNILPKLDTFIDYDLQPNEIAPIIDMCYNLGTGAFEKSTLLQKINANDFAGAQLEFLKFNIAGGHPMRGLTKRCLARATMFGSLSRQQLIDQHLGGVDPEKA